MFFLKGVLIGLIIGTPFGAVGALCMSRTLQYGAKSGFITGLGCSVADCLFAAVGAFGLTAVSAFLEAHDKLISVAGGAIIIGIGRYGVLRKGNLVTSMKNQPPGFQMFISSFCIGITNPAVVIVSVIAFSYLRIPKERSLLQSSVLVAGVFIGTVIWWFLLIGAIKLIKRRYGNIIGNKVNKIFGAVMITLGLIVLVRAFFIQ